MTPDVVALVTARGASKRLPRKNVLPLAGKPLIAWTLGAARAARSVRRILVSTDDPEIASTAKLYGGEVPFLRPAELAGDHAPHAGVVEHALRWLEASGDHPDYVLLLQPTSPLRTAEDIDGIVAFASAKEADCVVSLCPAKDHPLLCRRLDDQGTVIPYLPQPEGYLRTQDLPPAYVLNGAMYLIRPRTFLEAQTLNPPGTLGYIMPEGRSLDVDDAADLKAAEWLLGEQNKDGALLHGPLPGVPKR